MQAIEYCNSLQVRQVNSTNDCVNVNHAATKFRTHIWYYAAWCLTEFIEEGFVQFPSFLDLVELLRITEHYYKLPWSAPYVINYLILFSISEK